MAEHRLVRHPDGTRIGDGAPARRRRKTPEPTTSGPGYEISAAIELAPGPSARLRYRLSGDLTQVVLPESAASGRVHGLWEHTCFEAFIAPERHDGYVEINLAPSNAWAAYRFDGYRRGMRALELARGPAIDVHAELGELLVTADVDLSALTDARWPWRVGLCAVVEHAGGARSYWALKHPRSKPDFHDAEGFTVRLEGIAR